jgi:hypothetical protein
MNTGHGPGYRYDRPVGPDGGLRAAMAIFLILGGLCYLLQMIF